MNNSVPNDAWNSGQAYDRFMGRWSRPIARLFLDWLPPPLHWLELGCGTVALSGTILAQAVPASIVAVDPSAGFLAFARQSHTDPRLTFHVGDAQHLPPLAHPPDAAVAGLVLNFIPDPLAALQAVRAVLRPGGTLAA